MHFPAKAASASALRHSKSLKELSRLIYPLDFVKQVKLILILRLALTATALYGEALFLVNAFQALDGEAVKPLWPRDCNSIRKHGMWLV